MTKKLVLIDFDGVVLRNKAASSLVAKRAGLYTWHALQNRKNKYQNYSIGVSESLELCANLYKGYGHTLLGLKDLNISSSLKEYNDYVYSSINYDNLIIHNNHMHDVYQLTNFCNAIDVPILMFSNSPKLWIENMMACNRDLLDTLIDVRDTLHIQDDDATFLKPNKDIYDLISKVFYNYELIFVDDSACNIKAPLKNKQWKNVLFCDINDTISDRLYFINSLEKVNNMLST